MPVAMENASVYWRKGEARPAEPPSYGWGGGVDEENAKLRGERSDAQEVARLQHIIDCANTPLMRDVLRERDGLREQLDAAREALTEIAERAEYFARRGPRHPQNAEILANLARAALGVVGPSEDAK